MSATVIQPGNTPTTTRRTAAATPTSRPAKTESGRMTATQRNTFRMMLATGATLAALIGAQAMAVLDRTSATTPTVSQSSATGASAALNYGTNSSDDSSASSTSSSTYNSSSSTTYRQAQTQPRPGTHSS